MRCQERPADACNDKRLYPGENCLWTNSGWHDADKVIYSVLSAPIRDAILVHGHAKDHPKCFGGLPKQPHWLESSSVVTPSVPTSDSTAAVLWMSKQMKVSDTLPADLALSQGVHLLAADNCRIGHTLHHVFVQVIDALASIMLKQPAHKAQAMQCAACRSLM